MTLRSEEIARLLEDGRRESESDPLSISPCPCLDELKKTGSGAVDLRLGTWFVTPRDARMSHIPIGDMLAETQISKTRYIPFDKKYYLHPRKFVLAVTLEWLRLPASLSGFVSGRSSWGRRGLVVATAVAVHPGFTGCLTLELANIGEMPIELQPGTTICQLALNRTEGDATQVDNSQFVGLRKPIVGSIAPDAISQRLAARQD